MFGKRNELVDQCTVVGRAEPFGRRQRQLHRVDQGLFGLAGVRVTPRLDREVHPEVGTAAADLGGLAREALRERLLAPALRLVPFVQRHECADHRRDRQHEQQHGCTHRGADGAAMLTQLLTHQRVLGGAPHRCRDLREEIDQPPVAPPRRRLARRPRRVHPPWLTVERAPQRHGQRGRVRRPVVGVAVPVAGAVGEHHQQLLAAPVLDPPNDLARDRRGRGCGGGHHRHEPARSFERSPDRVPRVRARGGLRCRTGHPQRPPPPPRLPDPAQPRRQRRRQPHVLVRVGDKHIEHRRPRLSLLQYGSRSADSRLAGRLRARRPCPSLSVSKPSPHARSEQP